MADPKDTAAPSAVPQNWVHISNVSPGDCIPRDFEVTVSYSNVNLPDATVGINCPGSPTPPPVMVPPGPPDSKPFSLTHMVAASGHTISAALRSGGVFVTGHTVSPVGIGNPCPLKISGLERIVDGLPAVDANRPLAGTFDASKGNGIVLLVEQPAKVESEYMPPPPLLVFADPAQVDTDAGTWTHPVIQVAKKGQNLRVVLTKDGEVRGTIRAVFA
jgi:hypothetical protein